MSRRTSSNGSVTPPTLSGITPSKFGGDVRFQQNLRVPSDSHRSGEITFGPTPTEGPNGGGLRLASLLLGDASTFGRSVRNSTKAAERQKRRLPSIPDPGRLT